MTMRSYTFLSAALFGFWLGLAASACAEDAVPYLDSAGQSGYQEFTKAPMHSAFAIAPGGVWGWVSDMATPELAETGAQDACQQLTAQPCHLYALDNQVVFNETAWAASWILRLDPEQAAAAPVGTSRGMRLPDLAFHAPDGKPVTLADFRGKAVFLHFWGSWCPPCQTEFQDLQRLYDILRDEPGVAFIMIQARESIAKSRAWAGRRGITMPLYDSGHQGLSDETLLLGDGTKLSDRLFAKVYPSTYILDADGLVVFHQAGPGREWSQYAPLIRQLVTK